MIAQGSRLTGTGSITAYEVINSGTVSMGTTVGTLEIAAIGGVAGSGSFTQTATGTLITKLGNGTNDMFVVAGVATSGGNWTVTLVPGFTPGGMNNIDWQVLSWGSVILGQTTFTFPDPLRYGTRVVGNSLFVRWTPPPN